MKSRQIWICQIFQPNFTVFIRAKFEYYKHFFQLWHVIWTFIPKPSNERREQRARSFRSTHATSACTCACRCCCHIHCGSCHSWQDRVWRWHNWQNFESARVQPVVATLLFAISVNKTVVDAIVDSIKSLGLESAGAHRLKIELPLAQPSLTKLGLRWRDSELQWDAANAVVE